MTVARIGIDVGGSALKLGALDADARDVLWEDTVPAEPDAPAEALLSALVRCIESHHDGEIASVGLGLPGALDRARGVIDVSPNLPWLRSMPMRDEVVRRLCVAPDVVHLENDANAAALGERRFGRGREFEDMLFVTLGTGVGSGLVLGGELHIGAGLACEIGHLRVVPDGKACGCGGRGCLETVASASAARARAIERGLPGDVAHLTELARAQDGPERELLQDTGRWLGRGLAHVVVLLDVRTFVFGGGFSAALDVLRPGIEAGIREWSFGKRDYDLVAAELGNRAGWMGAACLGA